MLILILTATLLIAFVMGAGLGAVSINPMQILGIVNSSLGGHSDIEFTSQQQAILLAIRLPRVLMGLLIGSALASTGAAMQGLFRNPLADPGLIGVSSGASLAAVSTIVLGGSWMAGATAVLKAYTLPLASFVGALTVVVIVYRMGRQAGRTQVSTVLLGGVAINALAAGLTGFLIFFGNESQIRTIVFWSLGSLGGATWSNVLGIAPFILIPLFLFPRLAKPMNAISLGEGNAAHLGVNTEQVKRIVIVLTALAVGASVAVSGIIAFAGLIVPHIVRMLIGPDHRYLFIASALMGASLLITADLICRTIFAPAELPIGIITAICGAPFFIYILLREKKQNVAL